MSFDLKIDSGDLVIKNGQVKTVVDSEKLIQDILKISLTEAGVNPTHPWYGSFLSRAVIGTAIDNELTIQIAKTQLQTALDNLKELQSLQVKSLQKVSADEQIANVLSVSVNKNNIDPRYYDITIKVVSKGTKPVTTEFAISTI